MAPEVLLTEVNPLPGDVLQVIGYVDGEQVVATGWQSALTNVLDPDHPDRQEAKPGSKSKKHKPAEPREMSKAEVREYCENLLLSVVAQPTKGVSKLVSSIKLDDPPDDDA